ncbi:MAG: 6-bladed beta-propeller [Agriterribacter sp.]
MLKFETNELSVFNVPYFFLETDSNYIIGEERLKKLIFFLKDGSFSHMVRLPAVLNFFYDHFKKNIFVMTPDLKILGYNLKGELIEKARNNVYGSAAARLKNGYVFYNNFDKLLRDADISYRLYFTDDRFNVLSAAALPYETVKDIEVTGLEFSAINDTVILTDDYSNTVFNILDTGRINVRYAFDLVKRNSQQDITQLSTPDNSVITTELLDKVKWTRIQTVQEGKYCYYVEYNKEKYRTFALISKDGKSSLSAYQNGLAYIGYTGLNSQYIQGDNLYLFLDKETIAKILINIAAKKQNNTHFYNKLSDIQKAISTVDNPVMMKISLLPKN